MTIMQLKYFLAICSCGKISAAAEQLHVSGPTLSVSVRQLEEELGMSLFIRNNNQLSLTRDGERLQGLAQDVVDRFDRLAEQMKRPADALPVIEFGAPSTLAEFLCKRIIRDYTKLNPAALFEIPSHPSAQLVRMVSDGKLEIAVCDQQAVQSDQLEFAPIVESAVKGYVRRDHPLAGKAGVTAKMLGEEDLLLINKGSITYKELTRWFQRGGVNPNLFVYSHREILDVTVSMLEGHNAVAFLLDRVFEDSLPDTVSSFSLDPPMYFQTGMIRRAGKPLSENAQKFWDFCRDYAF